MGVGPGFTGQLVVGGADMLLQGVGEADATPTECVSAGYRLQKVVYAASPVREVASQSWAGGDFNGPPLSGFFGAVRFATADDAQGFFAASADKWRRCNGQTLVLHQPEHGADGVSRITDVVVEPKVVSAVVLHDDGSIDPAGPWRGVGLRCGRGGYGCRPRRRSTWRRRHRQPDAAENRRCVAKLTPARHFLRPSVTIAQ